MMSLSFPVAFSANVSASDFATVLRTPGVSNFCGGVNTVPIPEVEVERLRAVTKADYDIEELDEIPKLGEPVELISDSSVGRHSCREGTNLSPRNLSGFYRACGFAGSTSSRILQMKSLPPRV